MKQANPNFAEQPAALLQKLIQFDTTNPPGNERECVLFIRDLLAEAGIDTIVSALSKMT